MSYENACRLCLHFGELMCPLYECLIDESHPVRVVDFLKHYTKLSIYHEDGEPDQLCYNCLVEVQRIYTFVQKCEKTELTLKQLKDARGQLVKLKDIEVYPDDSDSSEDIIEIKEENLTEWSGYAIPIEDEDIEDQDSSRESEQIIVTPDVICIEDDSKSLSSLPVEKPKQNINNDLDFIDESPDSWNAEQPRRQKRRRTRVADKNQSKTCNICSRVFKHKKNLKRHILTVHSTVDLSIQCDICLRTYRNKDSLRSHNLSAHPEDNNIRKGSIRLRCPICSKHFEHMQSYKVHFQSHKEFICQFCSKAFRGPSELVAHLEDGDRGDFRCGLCSQKFERSSCLSVHEEHHKEEQELQCKTCFKIFTNKGALKTHMDVAHDVNPLRCTICSKQFRNKHSLGYHIRAMHPWMKGKK